MSDDDIRHQNARNIERIADALGDIAGSLGVMCQLQRDEATQAERSEAHSREMLDHVRNTREDAEQRIRNSEAHDDECRKVWRKISDQLGVDLNDVLKVVN